MHIYILEIGDNQGGNQSGEKPHLLDLNIIYRIISHAKKFRRGDVLVIVSIDEYKNTTIGNLLRNDTELYIMTNILQCLKPLYPCIGH